MQAQGDESELISKATCTILNRVTAAITGIRMTLWGHLTNNADGLWVRKLHRGAVAS